MEKRSDATTLKPGDRLSRVSYLEVERVFREDLYVKGRVQVKNQEGLVWTIDSNILENEAYSASQYSEEKEVNRTAMIEVLEGAGDTVFTVVFDKKTSQKSIVEALSELDSIPTTKKDLNKLAKSLLAGAERTMIGYLASTEQKMGRSTVFDLEAGQLRLVDHRTVKELIVKNVKYTLK